MHVVLSTAPPDAAQSLAAEIVERRLAACVNVVSGITSTYRWKGEVHNDDEALLIIKTSAATLPALMQELPALHPYDVPEIVALDATAVHADYALWVSAECARVKSD